MTSPDLEFSNDRAPDQATAASGVKSSPTSPSCGRKFCVLGKIPQQEPAVKFLNANADGNGIGKNHDDVLPMRNGEEAVGAQEVIQRHRCHVEELLKPQLRAQARTADRGA